MKLSGNAKSMLSAIGVSSLLFIAAGAVYYRSAEAFPFAYGVMLTSALNAVKVVLIERSVARVVRESAQSGKAVLQFQYLLRYALTAVVLVLAALAPFISLWGAIAGVFTFQIAAYAMKFFFRPAQHDDDTGAVVPEEKSE